MADDFKPVHGFHLNIAEDDGKAGIFLLPVFPENIIEVKNAPNGGSLITIRMANDETVTFSVTQPTGLICEMVARCKELDQKIG